MRTLVGNRGLHLLRHGRGDIKNKEKRINDFSVPRRKNFVDYIKATGYVLETVEDLLGLKESVTLEYEVIYGKTYLNITERSVINGAEKEGK